MSAIAEPGTIFFHANDLTAGLTFDEQLLYQRVQFDVVTDRVTGKPRAVDVRPAK